MGIFDKLLMTDEEKEQARQLNQIGYINALNTHNWELQQKLQVAENAQRQSQEELGLFLIKIGDRGYYVCEAVAKEIEKLRGALTAILNDAGYHNPMRMTTEISDKILEDAAGALHGQA